jgi:hypothetical protein
VKPRRKLDIQLEAGIKLPDELGQLKLTELRLGGRTLAALPAVILKIPTLERLDVFGLTALTNLADVAEQLPKLTSVNFWPKR